MKTIKTLFFLSFLFVSIATTNAQEHGVIFGSSYGKFYDKPAYGTVSTLDKSKFHYHIGYNYRQHLNNKFSIDMAGLYGTQGTNVVSVYQHIDGKFKMNAKYVALRGIVNYECFQNFRVGVGIEPSLYVSLKTPLTNEIKTPVDVPLIARLAYSFKYFELQLGYKQGTCNLVKEKNFNNVRSREMQVSLFVPIFNGKKCKWPK